MKGKKFLLLGGIFLGLAFADYKTGPLKDRIVDVEVEYSVITKPDWEIVGSDLTRAKVYSKVFMRGHSKVSAEKLEDVTALVKKYNINPSCKYQGDVYTEMIDCSACEWDWWGDCECDYDYVYVRSGCWAELPPGAVKSPRRRWLVDNSKFYRIVSGGDYYVRSGGVVIVLKKKKDYWDVKTNAEKLMRDVYEKHKKGGDLTVRLKLVRNVYSEDASKVCGQDGSYVGGFCQKPATVAQNYVVCQSWGYAYAECDTGLENPSSVRLVQQYSSAGCTLGHSYGLKGRRMWVDHGCRGKFLVEGKSCPAGYVYFRKDDVCVGFGNSTGDSVARKKEEFVAFYNRKGYQSFGWNDIRNSEKLGVLFYYSSNWDKKFCVTSDCSVVGDWGLLPNSCSNGAYGDATGWFVLDGKRYANVGGEYDSTGDVLVDSSVISRAIDEVVRPTLNALNLQILRFDYFSRRYVIDSDTFDEGAPNSSTVRIISRQLICEPVRDRSGRVVDYSYRYVQRMEYSIVVGYDRASYLVDNTQGEQVGFGSEVCTTYSTVESKETGATPEVARTYVINPDRSASVDLVPVSSLNRNVITYVAPLEVIPCRTSN